MQKIKWYDFGGTKVRGYGGTRIDSSRIIGRANYSRTPVPPYLRTSELSPLDLWSLAWQEISF
jgi:hypothetical protein